MGHGTYSRAAYRQLRTKKSYATKSRNQIFESRVLDPEMDPKKIILRESRDSDEHPNSRAVIIGLDVTGSMGFVPEDIVKERLPDLMDTMIQAGVADPQVLFMGLGDYVYDNAPLQVGQFESSAELLDRWLTKVYLEGGGGGNNAESYNLAYLFAARRTALDCWEKRRKKGFLFTIGDEPCATNVPGDVTKRITPAVQASTTTTEQLIAEAQKLYHVYHLHIEHNALAKTERRKEGWKELLGDNFVVLQDYKELSKTLASIVVSETQAESPSVRPQGKTETETETML